MFAEFGKFGNNNVVSFLAFMFSLYRAAVVAQRYSIRFVSERSWVRILPGAVLFFFSSLSS